MDDVRAVKQVELAVELLARLKVVLLVRWKPSGTLTLDDKGDPVVDHPYEQNEKSWPLLCSERLYLSVKLDYLVDCAMEETKAVFDNVHVNWPPSFLFLSYRFL